MRAWVPRHRGAGLALTLSDRPVLPSTVCTASAPRNLIISALNSPAHMPRYRRFTCRLAATGARLAEGVGWLGLAPRGLSPPPFCPVSLALTHLI